MKGALAAAAFGLSSLAMASICANNCGRQVAGTAGAKPPLASRQAMCSSFLATTTTVTPPVITQTPAVVYNRRHVRNRAVTPAPAPTVAGPLPSYATMCSDNVQYWSACQCFGIAPTTVTVTASTPTATLPAPTCTQGVEYALWEFSSSSSPQAALLLSAYHNFATLDRNRLVAGLAPAQVGLVAHVGSNEQADYSKSLQFDGVDGPPGVDMQRNILEHRGYLVPAALGSYTFAFGLVDDVAALWIGDHAQAGITVGQSVLNGTLGSYSPPLQYHHRVDDASELGLPVPFRVFWSNVGGPAGFLWSISGPDGAELLGYGTQKNPQIVASCSGPGTQAPEWPAWENES